MFTNETDGEIAALNPPSGGDIKGVAYVKGKRMAKRGKKRHGKRKAGRY
jgi:hypothetical protein